MITPPSPRRSSPGERPARFFTSNRDAGSRGGDLPHQLWLRPSEAARRSSAQAASATLPAVAWVDIEDNNAGDRTGHDGYVGRGPPFEPTAYLRLGGMSIFEGLPAHNGPLTALGHRHARPAAREVAQGGC